MFHDEPLTSRNEALVPGEDLSELGVEQLTERLEAALGTVEKSEATSEAYLNSQEQSQILSAELH